MRFILLSTIAAAILSADTTITGPSLGLVLDEAHAVRRVNGVFGASLMSDPLPLDPSLRPLAVSPDGEHILARSADSEIVYVAIGTGTVHVLANGDPGVEKVVFSPAGSAVAFVAGNRLQSFRNLQASREAGPSIRVSGSISALAISDDGKAILASREEPEGSALIAIDPDSNVQRILTGRGHIAIAFLAGRRDALVGDVAEGKLYVLRGSFDLKWLADVPGLAAVAALAGNAHALVIRSGVKSLTLLKLADGTAISSPEYHCEPAVLEPLKNGIFRITASDATPMYIVKLESDALRVGFVPKAENANE